MKQKYHINCEKLLNSHYFLSTTDFLAILEGLGRSDGWHFVDGGGLFQRPGSATMLFTHPLLKRSRYASYDLLRFFLFELLFLGFEDLLYVLHNLLLPQTLPDIKQRLNFAHD